MFGGAPVAFDGDTLLVKPEGARRARVAREASGGETGLYWAANLVALDCVNNIHVPVIGMAMGP